MNGNVPDRTSKKLTLGRLIWETARGTIKERTLSKQEVAELHEDIGRMFESAREEVRLRYFPGPLRFVEPESDSDVNGPHIVDTNGAIVAKLFWPGHPVEATEAAEQETYALGRAMAAALSGNSPSPDETAGKPLTPATLDTLIAQADKYILPVDVKIGAGTFRKGVKVGTMLRGLKSHAERQIATAGIPANARTWDDVWNNGCGYCDFDEAEGGIVDHCKACCTLLARIAIETGRHVDSQLARLLSERSGLPLHVSEAPSSEKAEVKEPK